eukprot:gene9588-19930_t
MTLVQYSSCKVLKQISKPLAARLKVEATKRPNFGSRCAYVGENVHQINSRVNVIASGYKFVGAKPLSYEDARNQGVDFLSELFVFSAAGGIIIIEFWRSETKAAIKAKETAAKEKNLEERFRNIETFLKDIETSLPRESKIMLIKFNLTYVLCLVPCVMGHVQVKLSQIRNTPPPPEEEPPAPTPIPLLPDFSWLKNILFR